MAELQRKRDGKIFDYWFISQMATVIETGLDQCQEAGTTFWPLPCIFPAAFLSRQLLMKWSSWDLTWGHRW